MSVMSCFFAEAMARCKGHRISSFPVSVHTKDRPAATVFPGQRKPAAVQKGAGKTLRHDLLPWLAIHLPPCRPCLFEHSFLGLQLFNWHLKWSTFDDTLMTHCILRHIAAYYATKQCGILRTVGGSTSDSRTTRVSCSKLHSGKQSSKANVLKRVAMRCQNLMGLMDNGISLGYNIIIPLDPINLNFSSDLQITWSFTGAKGTQRNPVRKLITVLILPKRRFYSTAHVPDFWPSRDCQKHRRCTM